MLVTRLPRFRRQAIITRRRSLSLLLITLLLTVVTLTPCRAVEDGTVESELLANADHYGQALLASPTNLHVVTFSGNPVILKDVTGQPNGVRFNTSQGDLLWVEPDHVDEGSNQLQSTHVPSDQCPWNLDACKSNQFTVKLGIQLDDVDDELATRSANAETTEPINFALFNFIKDNRLNVLGLSIVDDSARPMLKVVWLKRLQDKTEMIVERVFVINVDTGWHSLELTIKPNDDGPTSIGEIKWDGRAAASSSIDHVQEEETKSKLYTTSTTSGFLVGTMQYQRKTIYAIRQLDVTSPDTPLRRRARSYYRPQVHYRQPPQQQPPRTVTSITFEPESFMKYQFKNWLSRSPEQEQLTLSFYLPVGTKDGLLWFSEAEGMKNYIHLNDSRIYYTYVLHEKKNVSTRIQTDEIFLNTPLAQDRTHIIQLLRDKYTLTITLNDNSQARKELKDQVSIIPQDGRVYLGGTSDPSRDTNGKVRQSFVGSIRQAQLEHDGKQRVDLLQQITQPGQQRGVQLLQPSGVVSYDYDYPERREELIIKPTASLQQHSPPRGRMAKALALVQQPIPITLRGTQSSIVRFDTWDFGTYRSFEIQFMTFEPRGILFFVGPDRDHSDFVCLELFDGNLFFVYAVGEHYRHIRLNPEDEKVNTGTAKRVYVSRNERHRFQVKYNGREIDVDQGTIAHQTEFATYTYIGSVDQPSRLPWQVWSRENFAGCIMSIRVNDDKFLDPSSRMHQHTNVDRGVEFGACRLPDTRCSREICGGGKCAERSYPYFEPLNFACECSGSDKTFREGVPDIRRSETCFRDAPILEMDGNKVLLIDFERRMHTMTTHTDDISLQFRTREGNSPLFYAVSPVDQSYFRVDLVNGRVRIQTNINHQENRGLYEEFFLESPSLNDFQWHTLNIHRRADYLKFLVDSRYETTGTIPLLSSPIQTFKLVAQQIYLGSAGPANYMRPPAPNTEVNFLPPPPRFVGELRNFYWNEYDFIGTGQVPNKYSTIMLTPRIETPVFPQWPRDLLFSISCKPNYRHGMLPREIDLQAKGDMWLIEFKTEYDGVIISAQDPSSRNDFHITAVVLDGRLHIVYSIFGRNGVHQFTTNPNGQRVADGKWHRLVIGLERPRKQLSAYLDNFPPESVGNGLPVNDIRRAVFFFGGLPDDAWQRVVEIVRINSLDSLTNSEASNGQQPAITGCIGGFSLRAEEFAIDWLSRNHTAFTAYPQSEVVLGYCIDQRRCSSNYCRNGGRCQQISDREVTCDCQGTGFQGERCTSPVLNCPAGYCGHGRCSIINGRPTCDCTGTGYSGSRCEVNPCQTGSYCRNNGICTMIGTHITCQCRNTGFTGPQCETPICPPNYCNGGRCYPDSNDQPTCDCSGTQRTGDRCQASPCDSIRCRNGGRCVTIGNRAECDCSGTQHTGDFCDEPICPDNYCLNRGICRVIGTQRQCECRNTGFTGPQCETPICPPNYCNGGRCYPDSNDQPTCDCSGTQRTGDRCQASPCDSIRCRNGGRCVTIGNRAECDCSGTQHTGDFCDEPICPDNYCLNRGICRVIGTQRQCECRNTGFTGPRCEIPICPPNYCYNGGLCTVVGSQRQCECRTGFSGPRCQESICPPNYCYNGGLCTIVGSQPRCECRSTGFTGPRCQDPICPPNYCYNGGLCTIVGSQPQCECRSTGFTGPRCQDPICPPNYCYNNGLCRVVGSQAQCECRGTGFTGPRCQTSICRPGYCGRGRCYVGANDQPRCDCAGTGFTGDTCQTPTCRADLCFHGGRCEIVQGIPRCNCEGTDYQGDRCEKPKECPPGYCRNGGRCSVQGGQRICDCRGTGYQGPICSESTSCPPDYCAYGGICTVRPGNVHLCDCSRTGRGGQHCRDSTLGIYINYDDVGYLVYNLVPPVRTTQDNLTLGFKTYMTTGTLITFLTTDGKHWSVKLVDGKIVINANGRDLYGFQYPSNDGKYHVLNIERDGDSMTVEQDKDVIRIYLPDLASQYDKSITYNTIHIGANASESDIFRGVIGGVHWNGRYPIKLVKEGRYQPTGVVEIVLVPDFPLQPPRPQPKCEPNYCLNQGRCYAENYQLKCDCLATGYSGPRCGQESFGYLPKDADRGAYVVYTLYDPKRTVKDHLRVAFQTYSTDGPIIRVLQTDGSFYDLQLINGQLVGTLNGNRHIVISSAGQVFDDGKMHIVTIQRDGNRFTYTVDGRVTDHTSTGFVGTDGGLITREFVLGANRNFDQTFDGVIGAFSWNGKELIDARKRFVNGVQIMRIPGSSTPASTDEVSIVLMPHFMMPPGPVTTPPPEKLPDVLPVNALHGGAVMPPIAGDPLIAPGGYGGGASGILPGPGSTILAAGSALGAGGILMHALIAGLLLAALLLLSALIWACWKCKPGLCGFCRGKGDGAAGRSAWDRFCGSCFGQAEPEKETVGLLSPDATDGGGAKDATDFGGKGVTDSGKDVVDYHETYNLHQQDGGIYSLEGMKADDVLITRDSAFFVTSSGVGPPKVWDARSGEEFKVMDSDVWGCTDLHLACKDTVLVSQIIESDINPELVSDLSLIKTRRLQLWDFHSGRELQTPFPIICTATCITHSDSHVIVARSPEQGTGEYPSILAWDLVKNRVDRELFYQPIKNSVRDDVTFIQVGRDDRLAVAGFQDPDDKRAYYMLFDLSSNQQGLYQYRVKDFDAKVDATAILDKETAVTGTRSGQLIVWSLHTGDTLRHIQVKATLDTGSMTLLPAHQGAIHCVQLSADGRFLVTGGEDSMVRVWDMETDSLIHTLEGHADDVLSVAISVDSELIVSGSWDGSIRVWRLRDGNQICWFTSNIEILKVKISNDKNSLVALGEREGQRKLVTLRVIRNLVTKTTQLPPGSRVTSPLIPRTPGPYYEYSSYPSN